MALIYHIYKMRDDHVLSFAAEELKKYLHMMTQWPEILITTDPKATDGFRLGLLEDFGLPFEGNDAETDDVVHIDTTQEGGILAGSNPRSVLFAVYRFLKLCGCRFYFPGPDGEFIPQCMPTPQQYHKLADSIRRAHSIEGGPAMEDVLRYIDFMPKREMNTFGLMTIEQYQRRYYNHQYNSDRPAEELPSAMAEEQWRGLYQAEAQKRGLMIHSGEHDWVARSVGLDVKKRVPYRDGLEPIPEEVLPYFALRDGKRSLYNNDIYFSQLCLSQEIVRERLAQEFVYYVENHPQIYCIGFTLGDISKKHCECEECQKMIPSDWYVMILNRIDEIMTEKGMPNKVKTLFYSDMMFPPEKIKLNNPSRFTMDYCPIYRNYNSSLGPDSVIPEPLPYVRNAWKVPNTAEKIFSLFQGWKKVLDGPFFVYEYHFYKMHILDPGHMTFARRVYEDNMSNEFIGASGTITDGSMKSFFPNGFADYIYAESLLNKDLDYDKEFAAYYEGLYGADWQIVKDYLQNISDCFNFAYMQGTLSTDREKGLFYNPDRLPHLEKVKGITEEMDKVIAEHMLMPTRPQTNAWRILRRHTEYCRGLAEVMKEKCQGHDQKAKDMAEEFLYDFTTKYDFELEKYVDMAMLAYTIRTHITNKIVNLEL